MPRQPPRFPYYIGPLDQFCFAPCGHVSLRQWQRKSKKRTRIKRLREEISPLFRNDKFTIVEPKHLQY